MKPTFVKSEKPLLTVMLKKTNPTEVIKEIEVSLRNGAEAFGLQAENFDRKYHKPEVFKDIFQAMGNRPLYITNYKLVNNIDLSYEQLAEEMVSFAEMGATLCDVMGDSFNKHEEELTEDVVAIEKQMKLIDELHNCGAEVIMSSHINKYCSADKVLRFANEHKARGADISKIVTHANNMEEQIENIRIIDLLKRELDIPFLFLCGGECRIQRRVGILLGCCMSLCVGEDNPENPQPFVVDQKNIRDNMHF